MLHPNAQLRYVSDTIGYGVFASQAIPKGTITYVKDPMEISLSPGDYLASPEILKPAIDRYSYVDGQGYRILSWDIGKYVNHSCAPNTISTGYGFEIAIRDIDADEEITDEYGIFNLDTAFPCYCGNLSCRRVISPSDFKKYASIWDKLIKEALSSLNNVDQALMSLLDISTRQDLMSYLNSGKGYTSVRKLLWDGNQEKKRTRKCRVRSIETSL